MNEVISFNHPSFVGKELSYIAEAIQKEHISGDGFFTKKSANIITNLVGAKEAILTTSCTDALEMSALLLNISEGDEVILPSYTFVSTANAFVLRGAKLVFVDIREDTLNINENLIEPVITSRTKAIVVVHYAGVSCAMDEILALGKKHRVPVIEDNAHGFLGKYKGRNLGSIGLMSTLSFHETKNITCGEGGALILNDANFIDRAFILRDKGTNRRSFFQGAVDKYTWVDIGSSFLMSDILAAFLLGQLEQHASIQAKRKNIWNRYNLRLGDIANKVGVRLPIIPEECEQSYHMYYILTESTAHRSALMAHLKENGIFSVFHYLPLHSSKMGQQKSREAFSCPVTDNLSSRILRLPFYTDLSTDSVDKVVDTIWSSIKK